MIIVYSWSLNQYSTIDELIALGWSVQIYYTNVNRQRPTILGVMALSFGARYIDVIDTGRNKFNGYRFVRLLLPSIAFTFSPHSQIQIHILFQVIVQLIAIRVDCLCLVYTHFQPMFFFFVVVLFLGANGNCRLKLISQWWLVESTFDTRHNDNCSTLADCFHSWPNLVAAFVFQNK